MNPVTQLPIPPRRPAQVEELLLGAMLEAKDPGALLDIAGAVEFQDPRVRVCWDQLKRQLKRGRPVDAISFHTAAVAAHALTESDRAWLIGLQSANTLDQRSFSATADSLRLINRGHTVKLQLEEQARLIGQRGLQMADLTGHLEGILLQLARDYAPTGTADGAVIEVVDEWFRPKEAAKGNGLFVPTGLRVIDDPAPKGLGLTGFVPGLNQIFGDPGVGKSGIIGSCIEAQLELGYTVGLFGLEEGHRWLIKRLFAKYLGIKISDVGREVPVPGTKLHDEILEHAPRLAELLKRLVVYSLDAVSIDEIVRRGTDWILNRGVQIIYIDHVGEIRHRMGGGGTGPGFDNWAVAETYRRLRDLGNRRGVPMVALAHRKPDARDRKGPPRPNDVGLTGEAEKMVRRQLALWEEKNQLRCTITKNNEGAKNVTAEFVRLVEAGLIDPDLGRVVSLEQEAREKSEERKAKALEDKDAEAIRVRKRNKEIAALEKAVPASPKPGEPEEPTPQLDLLAPQEKIT